LALLNLFDRSEVLVSVKEAGGRYMHVSERMAVLLGHGPQDILGRTDADLLNPTEAAMLKAADQTVGGLSSTQWSEHRLERDGRRREFSVNRLLMPAREPASPLLVSAWVELTDTRQREVQLQQALIQLEQQQLAVEALRRETQDQSLRDSVTGLYQRIHFDDQLRRELDLSAREHREFALVSIAVDPLKDPTHAVGSEAHVRVLEALGRLLRSNTRAMDASCRLEEDRFAVLLSGVGLATAHSRMEGLRRQCATQIVVLGGRDLGFTVSMGVASFPHTAHTEEELVNAAAAALGEAQRRGGNHVTLASIRFDTP
jgi:diguanylate cyclase (GGDEF)-like protein/PAS domain S-box-containing protein